MTKAWSDCDDASNDNERSRTASEDTEGHSNAYGDLSQCQSHQHHDLATATLSYFSPFTEPPLSDVLTLRINCSRSLRRSSAASTKGKKQH